MKIELSHHERDGDGNFKSVKPLVFLMDEPVDDGQQDATKKEKEKKKKKLVITSRNFGAFVSIPAVKSAENLVLAWRCRPLGFSPSLDVPWKFIFLCWAPLNFLVGLTAP